MGLWVLADLVGSVKPIHHWQHDVHQDEMWQLRSGHVHSLFTVACHNGVIA